MQKTFPISGDGVRLRRPITLLPQLHRPNLYVAPTSELCRVTKVGATNWGDTTYIRGNIFLSLILHVKINVDSTSLLGICKNTS